jgi:hypothetical protein
VKQKDSEQELVYNKEDLLNSYFLCLWWTPEEGVQFSASLA